ncbi:hypothetical protein KCU80_g23351, partial [Aureobasidium melanogenum]
MESAQVKSAGDTTFLLEQHTPDPTPIEEKKAPMSESNPIEAAKASIAAPAEAAAPSQSTTATSDTATSATSDTPIKTTTNVYQTDNSVNDKADSTSSSKPEARSSYRPGSKALDLPPPVTRSIISDSKTGPPLPVTTSASELPLPVCPDPAAHTAHRDTRLQEQASNAALYVTKTGKSTKQKEDVLDANNKLSSRSAAASLKYASPQDLPSYPVVGIDTTSSAHSAANLANSGHKQFEHWKPDPSKNAGIAAMAAKDYKM